MSVQSQIDDVWLKPAEGDDLITSQSAGLPEDAKYAELQAADQKRRDALERIRRQLDDLTRSIGDTSAGPQMQNDRTALRRTESIADTRSSLEYQPQETTIDRRRDQHSYRLPTTNDSDVSDSMSTNEPVNGAGIAGRTAEIHTNLDSFSQAKFDQLFNNGQFFLTAGRYYEAAKSFELALMYKPDDPFCLAGKGHALFAAGEYVSSAMFISRALEVYPEYTRAEVNLTAVLGGSERMEKRIADAEQWLTKSGSNQLEFLLSYIYYRTGKLDKAKSAIDVVDQKIPQSQYIEALKAAINEKLTKQ